MAKKSEKKDKKLKAQYNKIIFIIISVASSINLFYNFFCYLKKNYIYSKKEIFGIIILVILDLIYYKILNKI